MPAKCCVPNCTSTSYTLDKVAFFSFPREAERRQEWLKFINREDIVIKRSTLICSKHFEEKYIIREHRAVNENGKLVTLPRDRPKLKEDAVPTMYILDQYTWTPPSTNTTLNEGDLEVFDTLTDPFSGVYLDTASLENLDVANLPLTPLEPESEPEPEPKRRREVAQQTDLMRLEENEFDIFGRSVAMQLRNMPLSQALRLQLRIQALITEDRLAIPDCL